MTPVPQMSVTVGQQLTLACDPNPWTVTAVSDHFAALTRLDDPDWENGDDDPEDGPTTNDRDTIYTVLDWRNGVRGPCNLSGQGWGDGTYTEAECAQMLAEFETGDLEVSHRNRMPIAFGQVAW